MRLTLKSFDKVEIVEFNPKAPNPKSILRLNGLKKLGFEVVAVEGEGKAIEFLREQIKKSVELGEGYTKPSTKELIGIAKGELGSMFRLPKLSEIRKRLNET